MPNQAKASEQFKKILNVNGKKYHYYSFDELEKIHGSISQLPVSLRILLENQLRYLDNDTVNIEDIKAIIDWQKTTSTNHEIAYRPARVLMQDFTGVPAVVDLAAMRDAVAKLGKDPQKVNPLSDVDLVIDHSVIVDYFGSTDALEMNIELEMQRNSERYNFLRWGQKAFDNFRVVPPGVGICHQVNLEYLAQCVYSKNDENGELIAFPDTLVGTDSHTTMINGLGVLGWGVGGIEAEAAMLGQPISMLIPEVVGVELTGRLKEGITATDLVLTVTEMLRKQGVVGKFVEFFGDGLKNLPLADRATIANMAPEYGATCGFFPIDDATLDYLRLSNRSEETISRVEQYAKAQGLWNDPSRDLKFTVKLHLDISTVESSLAGPKRPQDRVPLSKIKGAFNHYFDSKKQQRKTVDIEIEGKKHTLRDADVVIAAITSCTNTSNPSVMIAAGLLAKKAIEKELSVKPWVKTSLAPGSKVVTDYLDALDLTESLNQVGFNLVGYGCTTCIGNSGELLDPINHAISENDLIVASVLSGNRNFEGRVHPLVQTNWLASPPLVVAFAIAGRVDLDMYQEPIAQNNQGEDIYLKDIWPSNSEIADAVNKVNSSMFKKQYATVFDGDEKWQSIKTSENEIYDWEDSTYINHPPYFQNMAAKPNEIEDIIDANILAILGDSVTTDHISPAGSIKKDSPAGLYLSSKGVAKSDFNSYGSRRGNHEVMMRGTFANVRIKNEMTKEVEGGFTRLANHSKVLPIYDAAMIYQKQNKPLVVIAGKEYGTGSSRDWAAKGTKLLGVSAVIVESFERIHRSNLIGMGVLPLQFADGVDRKTLNLTGDEKITIQGLNSISPKQIIKVQIERLDGSKESFNALIRIDTSNELVYFKQGGILHYVLRKMIGLV